MKPVIVDQSSQSSSWGVVQISGNDRVRFMQGMVIGDVAALGEGEWLQTATLSIKGRVMSIFDLVARPEDLVMICQPGQAEATVALLSKFAIVDDVEFTPMDEPVHRVWQTPADVWAAPPVFAEASDPSTAEAIEVRRIEGGYPLYGIDITEANFPFETPLTSVINYDKGCYIGQEPVHRVHAKGQPQKAMRGLRFEGDAIPAIGETIVHPERAKAGTLTSAIKSSSYGVIGLAILHRTAYSPGETVTCGGIEAKIVVLPFSA